MALGRTSNAAYYWTISGNGRAENLVKSLSSAQRTDKGKTEVIITVKISPV